MYLFNAPVASWADGENTPKVTYNFENKFLFQPSYTEGFKKTKKKTKKYEMFNPIALPKATFAIGLAAKGEHVLLLT